MKILQFFKISLKFVAMDSNDNRSALIQVMVWRRNGDKPLPKQMLNKFIDACNSTRADELNLSA